jgi:hypothetical protein
MVLFEFVSVTNEYVGDVTIPTQVIKYNQNFLQEDQPIILQNSNQIKLLEISYKSDWTGYTVLLWYICLQYIIYILCSELICYIKSYNGILL